MTLRQSVTDRPFTNVERAPVEFRTEDGTLSSNPAARPAVGRVHGAEGDLLMPSTWDPAQDAWEYAEARRELDRVLKPWGVSGMGMPPAFESDPGTRELLARVLGVVQEMRDLQRPLLSSDTSKGLAALRGRKTFLRLLLGILPAHDAASLLPGTDSDNKDTLGRRGLISEILGNRGGVVVVKRLRRLLAGEGPEHSNDKPPRCPTPPGELKRSTLFDN